ncbi:Uncharacterised protein [Delftia tsuruhatensis]|nr:Uncharacterised protein [Delftia tsuruhatensis]
MGVSVSETTAEIRMATAMVMANSWNSRPTTSPMNSSGISTAISEIVSEMMVKPICLAPLSAACMGGSPFSTWRAMFSIITMASSTTKPVEIVSAISVRLLIEKPARYITPKVPISDSGTAKLGISVAEALRRNTKITATTRAMASISSSCMSSTEARMVTVRSVSTCTSSEAGSVSLSWGSRALMRSTVSITLAPGWRRMLRITPAREPPSGVPAQAARRVFSASSTVWAMSDRRTGRPFLKAMMRLRYSAADCSWSLASMVEARAGPSKPPLACLTLAAAMAVRTSSSVMPRLASAVGLAWMRTAGRRPPAMATRPTPLTCESLGASRFSTRSLTRITGSVGEVMASVRMGASAGLTLLYSGGMGRSPGSRLAPALMAACTCCSATSMAMSSAKRSVITEAPPELVDDICARPGIWPSWRSSGAVTLEVITSGLAPGYRVVTWMVG